MSRSTNFLTNDILPPPPEGAVPVLHNREYRAEAYRLKDGRLLIQGGLRDQKPPGLFIPNDPEPLTIHHMMLSIIVGMPSMVIEEVQTEFPAHPQPSCPSIIDHYDNLVGLSISRGFTHKVRDLFGGPRGCSHTTMLLQAMAPIAMQSFKSMEIAAITQDGNPHPLLGKQSRHEDTSWKRLVNTCHVWAEDGEQVTLRQKGELGRMLPITMELRLKELGIVTD